MGQFLIRVEAVNLGNSVFDTEDLSTIRGGGYANLLIPGYVRDAIGALHKGTMRPVFEGASQAVGILTPDDEATTAEAIETSFNRLLAGDLTGTALAEALPGLADVLPHLTVLGVAVPMKGDADYRAASLQALARLRTRQFMRPTIDLPQAKTANRPCAIDGTRPATTPGKLPGNKDGRVSDSVAARRAFGRKLRQTVYQDVLGGDAATPPAFAESFHDLVRDQRGLPPSLRNKMAVVHMDGNKFTHLRDTAVGAADDPPKVERRFSETVKAGRKALLKAMLGAFEGDPRMRTPDGRLRFETLAWGGDEAAFVLPAWKVMDLLAVMAANFKEPAWTFDGAPLTHGVGVLVCHYKMPIAVARDLADALGRSAKNAVPEAERGRQNAVSLQLVESIEPVGELDDFRASLYGTGDPTAFAFLDVQGWKDAVEIGKRLANPRTGFPRSQLSRLLTLHDQDVRGKNPEERQKAAGEALEAIAKRTLRGGQDEGGTLDARISDLNHPVWGTFQTEAPFLRQIRLAELWDLFHPFGAERDAEAA